MPRPSSGANLSIAQLERMLNERRSMVNRLMKRRSRIQRQLDEIDRQIGRNGGGGGGMRGGNGRSRARNEHNLIDTMETVMRKAGKPMRVPDIVQAVENAGYRSTSANFRGIINQALIKDKRFASVDRGIYQVKARAAS